MPLMDDPGPEQQGRHSHRQLSDFVDLKIFLPAVGSLVLIAGALHLLTGAPFPAFAVPIFVGAIINGILTHADD